MNKTILKPVINQLEAYNNRDIDQFILNFSEECIVEDGLGNVLMVGREAMYVSYGEMFAKSPDLYCNIVSRVVVGNYVLDEERVTGRGGILEESHVVAVYRVESEQIVHVRFLK